MAVASSDYQAQSGFVKQKGSGKTFPLPRLGLPREGIRGGERACEQVPQGVPSTARSPNPAQPHCCTIHKTLSRGEQNPPDFSGGAQGSVRICP